MNATDDKAEAQKQYWQAKFDEIMAQAKEASADTRIFIKDKLKHIDSLID